MAHAWCSPDGTRNVIDDAIFTGIDPPLTTSSSTETESGYLDKEVNIDTPLAPGQLPSDRFCARTYMKWIQTYVKFDYTAAIEKPPSWRGRILARITNRKVGDARSIWVPRPAVGEEEWPRLQKLFYNFWVTLAAVAVAWVINRFLIITRLGAGWRGARRMMMRTGHYVEDFTLWRKVRWNLYRCDPESRGPYRAGQILLLSRDKVCFRLDKSFVKENTQNLLRDSYCQYVGFPFHERLHIVHLDHSSKKIRGFLDYLCGATFDEILRTVPSSDDFGLRTSLYRMARQYATEKVYAERKAFFAFPQWKKNGKVQPLDIFAVACRVSNIDISLARCAIIKFAELETTHDAKGNARDWLSWCCHDISWDSLEARHRNLTRKMHSRHLKAYDAAHHYVCALISDTANERANEQYRMCCRKREAALLLLADAFCRGLKFDGFSAERVKNAEKTLGKRHYDSPTPCNVSQ